jgi:4-amino-4-deoxy-L-arabinose transferase-like glycosyltransferase
MQPKSIHLLLETFLERIRIPVRAYYVVFACVLGVIYLQGLFSPQLLQDAARDAAQVLHRYKTGQYAVSDGVVVWLGSLSFQLLGVSAFAFRLPSFLATLVCLYATYRLGTLLYTKKTGMVATIILASSCWFVLACNDPRLDAILTACILCAIWQMVLLVSNNRLLHAVTAGLAMGIGFSAKGSIAVLMPLLVIALHIVQQRAWRKGMRLFPWVVVAAIALALIAPTLYGYHGQVNRFVKRTGPVFYLHTFFRAFLPWSLVCIAAYTKEISYRFRKGLRNRKREVLTGIAPVIAVVLLTLLSSKWPHYLHVTFPLLAIFTAAFLLRCGTQARNRLIVSQQILATLVIIGIIVLCDYCLPVRDLPTMTGILILLSVTVFFLFENNLGRTSKVMLMSLSLGVFLFFVMSFHYYPEALKFQAGRTLAARAAARKVPVDNIFGLAGFEACYDFGFYMKADIPLRTVAQVATSPAPHYLVTGPEGLEQLKTLPVKIDTLEQAVNYNASTFNIGFLDPSRRDEMLSRRYLLRVVPQ